MDGPTLQRAPATPRLRDLDTRRRLVRDTAGQIPAPDSSMETGHERRSSLWALVAGDHQLAGVHHLRVQFRQAAIASRLALVWCVLGLPGRALHRDVRLSPDDLPVLRLVDFTLPGCRLGESRCRPLARDGVRLAHQSALRAVSRAELHLHRWRLLAALGLVAGYLSCATRAPPGDVRPLRTDAPPAVRGLRAHHVWLPGAMANAGHL